MGIAKTLTRKVKQAFARLNTGAAGSSADHIYAGKQVTNSLAQFLIDITNWRDMDEADIYEQMYSLEPEVGGAIDRISTMTSDSFKRFKMSDKDTEYDELEAEMLREAEHLAATLNIKNEFEKYAELLMMHGNVYIHKLPGFTYEILPNKSVTILDDLSRIGGSSNTTAIRKANYYILDEGLPTEQRFPADEIIHIKFKDTPIWWTDSKGRKTFGIYSISPLHRTVLPIWEKRQITIIDVIWRWRNVPREQHQIDASLFSLDKYPGNIDQRRKAANADMERVIASYARALKDQTPDQGYVTSSAVTINPIEHSSSYLSTNDRITQNSDQVWTSLSLPHSVVAGGSSGSYSSDLVLSSYVASKIEQLANKIKPVILDNIRKRLLAINSSYPVDEIDIKIEYVMANSKIELARQMVMMKDVGIFTETELRNLLGYLELRKDQRPFLVSGEATSASKSTEAPPGPQYPETPHSSAQHSTDAGTAAVNRSLRSL